MRTVKTIAAALAFAGIFTALFWRAFVYPQVKFEKFANTVVNVDREAPLSYPSFVVEVLHPELQSMGPASFNLTMVREWRHEDQRMGWQRHLTATGEVIYERLKTEGVLADCLGFSDLVAMNQAGMPRSFYAGKSFYGWKSVVRDEFGDLFVPYLTESSGQIFVKWERIDNKLGVNSPALLFKK